MLYLHSNSQALDMTHNILRRLVGPQPCHPCLHRHPSTHNLLAFKKKKNHSCLGLCLCCFLCLSYSRPLSTWHSSSHHQCLSAQSKRPFPTNLWKTESSIPVLLSPDVIFIHNLSQTIISSSALFTVSPIEGKLHNYHAWNSAHCCITAYRL